MLDRRIQFDEKYVDDENGTTTLHFIGPKEMLNGVYPDAETVDAASTEISIEFPTEFPEARFASVEFSPTLYDEVSDSYSDVDWFDVDLPYEEIEALISLSSKEYVNAIDGTRLSQADFVDYVYDEAQRQFNACHGGSGWSALTDEEMYAIFCEQFDYLLEMREWFERPLCDDNKILVSFCTLLEEPMGSALDRHFEKNGWELQAWDIGRARGYQVFFGESVPADNLYGYGFPYLYNKEETIIFAKDFYERKIHKDTLSLSEQIQSAEILANDIGKALKKEEKDFEKY